MLLQYIQHKLVFHFFVCKKACFYAFKSCHCFLIRSIEVTFYYFEHVYEFITLLFLITKCTVDIAKKALITQSLVHARCEHVQVLRYQPAALIALILYCLLFFLICNPIDVWRGVMRHTVKQQYTVAIYCTGLPILVCFYFYF